MSDLVVYTATFGGYDRLWAPAVVNPEVKHIAFVDEQVEACEPWELIRRPTVITDGEWSGRVNSARFNRIHKLNPMGEFPGAEWSIYIDANCELLMDPTAIIANCQATVGDHDMYACAHPVARCAYHEGTRVKRFRKADPAAVDRQMAAYRAEGFPAGLGLTCNRVLIRRHTPAVEALMSAWWSEIERHTHRDQLSLQYVCWKLGFTVGVLPAADMRRMVRVHPHGS